MLNRDEVETQVERVLACLANGGAYVGAVDRIAISVRYEKNTGVTARAVAHTRVFAQASQFEALAEAV